ncbi:MAG: hypothetical protein WC726_00855 [Parcubacteria group bacterium]|jgi:hypothetical protein
MFVKIFNKTPEQYAKLLAFLASEQNITQKGMVFEDEKIRTEVARIPAQTIAYVAKIELHKEQDGGGYGNMDITIGISVRCLGSDGKFRGISRKILDDILDLMEVFGD